MVFIKISLYRMSRYNYKHKCLLAIRCRYSYVDDINYLYFAYLPIKITIIIGRTPGGSFEYMTSSADLSM